MFMSGFASWRWGVPSLQLSHAQFPHLQDESLVLKMSASKGSCDDWLLGKALKFLCLHFRGRVASWLGPALSLTSSFTSLGELGKAPLCALLCSHVTGGTLWRSTVITCVCPSPSSLLSSKTRSWKIALVNFKVACCTPEKSLILKPSCFSFLSSWDCRLAPPGLTCYEVEMH